MSSIQFELDAVVRESKDKGKGASRRLRHTNKVPAIVYGAEKPAESVTLEHNKVMHALQNEAFYSHILTLKIGKESEKVILKALQRHPAKPRILHMDFLRVSANQKLHMHIPLHFKGEEDAPGIKEGGVFAHAISDVEVSCLPADLPEFIEVDASQLHLNQSILLSELKLPKGVTLVAFAHGVEEHDQPVISIHLPRIEKEEEPVTTEEGAEGEAVTEGEEKEGETEQAATEEHAEHGKKGKKDKE